MYQIRNMWCWLSAAIMVSLIAGCYLLKFHSIERPNPSDGGQRISTIVSHGAEPSGGSETYTNTLYHYSFPYPSGFFLYGTNGTDKDSSSYVTITNFDVALNTYTEFGEKIKIDFYIEEIGMVIASSEDLENWVNQQYVDPAIRQRFVQQTKSVNYPVSVEERSTYDDHTVVTRYILSGKNLIKIRNYSPANQVALKIIESLRLN